MAKNRAPKKMQAAITERATRPVRLDLTIEDHERLERCAKRYGISKSSYVRMTLFKGMESDESNERRGAK